VKKEASKLYGVRMNKKIFEILQRIAKESNSSVAGVIRQAIEEFISRR
jgi:predicted transcriptional regulator